MNIDEKFIELVNTHSDINEHLNTLFEYALKCDTIAEFGVRDIVSTFAFAKARPKKITCVDVLIPKNINEFIKACEIQNINCEFFKDDTLKFSCPILLFRKQLSINMSDFYFIVVSHFRHSSYFEN